jgi:opine dehydrogenase
MSAIKKIAVLGAGHGGFAAAADLTRLGFEVTLQSRNAERLAEVKARGGIAMQGVYEGFVPIKAITTDVARAIEGADLIMLVVPSIAIGHYARELAPLMTPERIVLINPGHTGGGLAFVAALREAGYRGDVQTCETVTLTYICRMSGPASVNVYSYTRNLAFAAFPGRHADTLYRLIKPIYPQIVPASNVLETALNNINATFHPPGMLMNAGWIEHTGGDFMFYREGITPSVGRVTEAIDAERMAVARALGVPSRTFLEGFYRAGLTSEEGRDSGSISKACYLSEPNRLVKSPPQLDHRYIHEDIGYGLVPMAALGELVGVPTPTMDIFIDLAGIALGTDFRREGLTLKKMGLAGIPPAELAKFLEMGS